MKTVILCGGRGTRLGEHGAAVPKALIDIGGRPVLWHLLRLFIHQGLKDFILCLGHLGDEIKRHFDEHPALYSGFTIGSVDEIGDGELPRVLFADTGLDTNTGGRIHRVANLLGDDETFCATYGDGLADIDLGELLAFHNAHGRIATLTTVHPQSPFGMIHLDDESLVTDFDEKPVLRDWINGGFFVFDRRILGYLDEDSTLEREPFQRLAADRQLVAYKHVGFWKCMDTYKDNLELNGLWKSGKAEWKVWKD